MLMSWRRKSGLITSLIAVSVVVGLMTMLPSLAMAENPPSDDGQVIVVPGDGSGRYAPPHIDMQALDERGQAPVRPGGPRPKSPGGPEGQAGAGGSVDSPSGIPPGCFVGGFGGGGGPGGIGPRAGAFG